MKSIIIIFGPTASGKSSFAQKMPGIHINADSMQIYQDLKILSARDDILLSGEVNATQHASVAWWYKEACKLVENAANTPIFVGGTGLYVQALQNGLATIPKIPQAIIAEVDKLCQQPNFYNIALQIDPASKTLKANDIKRLRRAVEVKLFTNKSISEFVNNKIIDFAITWHFFWPNRLELYQNINKRAEKMLSSGAIEEVEALLQKSLPKSAPIMQAIGVKIIKEYLENHISYSTALELLQQQTRQYAKRQITWLRHLAATCHRQHGILPKDR